MQPQAGSVPKVWHSVPKVWHSVPKVWHSVPFSLHGGYASKLCVQLELVQKPVDIVSCLHGWVGRQAHIWVSLLSIALWRALA